MQVFKERRKTKNRHTDIGKSKSADAQRTKAAHDCVASNDRQRLLELANEAGLRAKKKDKWENALSGSVVGTAVGLYMMAISTTTTVCRTAISNPYLLAAGAVVAAIGVGLLLYFGTK